MVTLTVNILADSRVLVLEDSPARIAWFKKHVANVHIVSTVDEFVKYFRTKPTVDFIFLDHDLGTKQTGYDAACYLAKQFGSRGQYCIIHSWNKPGALRMQAKLPLAHHIPFGEFEIAYD